MDNKPIKSPSNVGFISFIALGIILMVGGVVAARMLYPHQGYISLSCLSTIPIGAALMIAVAVRYDKASMKYTHQLTGRSRSGGMSGTADGASQIIADAQELHSNNKNVVSIGSQEARLDEKGIQEELKKINGRKDIDVLIIYGDGSVRFNTDPGFVDINPKKVILVGARIIHAAGWNRLDDTLADKGWLSVNALNSSIEEATWVKQLEMYSIQAALDHIPDMDSKKQRYHVVYRVNEYPNHNDN